MNKIIIGDLHIDVIKKDVKNVSLAVYPPTSKIILTTPLVLDDERIRLYAISKLSWIYEGLGSLKKFNYEEKLEYNTCETHYFLGSKYLLDVKVSESKITPSIVIRDNTYIDMIINKNTSVLLKEKLINNLYKKELKLVLDKLILKWEAITGVNVNKVKVRRMKNIWGNNCIKKKILTFNLTLAQEQENHIEYVVVHEMMHFFERYHNTKFKILMSKYFPKWRIYRQELQLNKRLDTD